MGYFGGIRLFYVPKSCPFLMRESRAPISDAVRGESLPLDPKEEIFLWGK